MRLHHAIFTFSIIFIPSTIASESSWMFQAGSTPFDDDRPRVAQYEPERPSYVSVDPKYQESGYRHEIIQAGDEWLNLVQRGPGHRYPALWRVGYPIAPAQRPMVPGQSAGTVDMPLDSWRNPRAESHAVQRAGRRRAYGLGRGRSTAVGSQINAATAVCSSGMGTVSLPPPPGPADPRGQSL